MIKVLFGKRGMGKTKQMREWANNRIADARGTVVFIDKDNDHMYELDRNIRFINAVDYGVAGCEMLTGFICGIAARDFDLEAVYVNSFARSALSRVSEKILLSLFFHHKTLIVFIGWFNALII